MDATEDVTPPRNGTPPGLRDRSSRIAAACKACRQRKVRCDNNSPCSMCVRAGSECVRRLPRPESYRKKRSRSNKKALNDDSLFQRLQKLESTVISLRSMRPLDPESYDIDNKGNASNENSDESQMVRLLAGSGRSRYVSDRFWASLTSEIEDVSTLLVERIDERASSAESSTEWGSSPLYEGLVFPCEATVGSLLSFYPEKCSLPLYWHLFVENIDPMIRLVHKPSVEKIFLRAADDLLDISPGEEVMIFSICFSVIASISEDSVVSLMGDQKKVMLRRYKLAIQHALSQVGLLETQELVVLQAFVLYLVSLQGQEDSQVVWTLTGLAIRIAEAMGVHRDGDVFKLPPFETEVRRRLWWNIYMLDNRACERQGFTSKISKDSFDTKLPLNISDEDIHVDDNIAPIPRSDCSEMTFCLIRYKFASTIRSLQNDGKSLLLRKYDAGVGHHTFAQRKKMVEECEKRIENEHLQRCFHDTIICRFATSLGRMLITKMWLELYHPLHSHGNPAPLMKAMSDRLFTSSIETIESCWRWSLEPVLQKWAWYCRSYVQWHSVAFVLSELCHRGSSPESERAWSAVDSIFSDLSETPFEKKNSFRWKPLQLLKQRALLNRKRQTLPQTKEAARRRSQTDSWTAEHVAKGAMPSASEITRTDMETNHFPQQPRSQVAETSPTLTQTSQMWTPYPVASDSISPTYQAITLAHNPSSEGWERFLADMDLSMDWRGFGARNSLEEMDYWW